MGDHRNIMVSQIINNSPVCSTAFYANNKENIKFPYSWSFVRRIYQSPVDSWITGSVMWKTFAYLDVIKLIKIVMNSVDHLLLFHCDLSYIYDGVGGSACLIPYCLIIVSGAFGESVIINSTQVYLVVSLIILVRKLFYVMNKPSWSYTLLKHETWDVGEWKYALFSCLTDWRWDKMVTIFADDIFQRIFLNENFWIANKISLKHVP